MSELFNNQIEYRKAKTQSQKDEYLNDLLLKVQNLSSPPAEIISQYRKLEQHLKPFINQLASAWVDQIQQITTKISEKKEKYFHSGSNPNKAIQMPLNFYSILKFHHPQ